MNAIELSTCNVDAPSSETIRYPDERQRAGYLSLGFMLSAASLVGLQVRLMPSTLFAFCALLCLIQLSSRALRWFETNGVARHTLSLWRRLGAFPRLFRLAIFVLVTVLCTVVLVLGPRPLWHFEMTINALLFAGLLLFVGPQRRARPCS
ncbi:uncharacterized membrane protein YbaN (DUF454 family) [Ochrobactrum sp. 19YEA23]|uniref:DUF454 family protein n=1 Tax=Ochrobactrum sp. 19YEA23 TaxID=3039854 RepID=UPI0024796F43|nr:uncharacterized membrane protein YbaN (DUF454 family) [Ochrobactrum sp. 19YEA23]